MQRKYLWHTAAPGLILGMLLPLHVHAADVLTPQVEDPHYNEAGFFDIHVCNWPDRAPFFMSLFSTPRFGEVDSVEVFFPNGSLLTEIDLQNYRLIERKQQPYKRVFLNEFDIPPGAPDGWYSTRITLKNGKRLIARDYVILSMLPQATGHIPAHEEDVTDIPQRLDWEPVPGAGFYQVFIRDLWNDSALIYTSKLLREPELELPAGLLEKGGYYSWVIHARDLNEHIMLGDFNHGSVSPPATFSILP